MPLSPVTSINTFLTLESAVAPLFDWTDLVVSSSRDFVSTTEPFSVPGPVRLEAACVCSGIDQGGRVLDRAICVRTAVCAGIEARVASLPTDFFTTRLSDSFLLAACDPVAVSEGLL